MSAREVVVLGTASQVPTRQRNHNACFLAWDAHGVLFDPGEGTQRQLLHAGIAASRITRICVTHFHGDHSLGLPGVIQRLSLDRVPHEVPVHFPEGGRVYFDRLRHATIFKDESRLRPAPIVAPGPQEDGDPALIALPLEHTVECWGFRVQEPDRVRLLPERLAEAGIRGPDAGRLLREGEVTIGGRRVRLEEVSEPRPGQSMAYVMDTRLCDAAIALARGVDLLVCESTYLASEAREARERGHLTATDAATIARRAGARRLVLTHFSQRHPDPSVFLEEARASFDDVHAARDGDRVALPPRGGP